MKTVTDYIKKKLTFDIVYYGQQPFEIYYLCYHTQSLFQMLISKFMFSVNIFVCDIKIGLFSVLNFRSLILSFYLNKLHSYKI